MTKRTTFSQADVARAIRGALKGGLAPGSFKVEIEDGKITISPFTDAPLDEAADMARRMRKAFGY